MSATRMGRINEEIQRALAELIRTVKDPRVQGLISITRVESDADQVVKGLKSAAGYLRRELGHALSLRATPELTFVRDDSMAHGAHILQVMEDLDREGRL